MYNSDKRAIRSYIQIQNITSDVLFSEFPELEDPSNELQYRLLKVEYKFLEFNSYMFSITEVIINAISPSMENLTESFSKLGDSFKDISNDIFSCDEEIQEKLKASNNDIKHYKSSDKKHYYTYIMDIRNNTRRYLRNHVY